MCGIVGAVAERNVVPIVVEGLRRLEYRGYDSVGIATWNEGADGTELKRIRVTERVNALQTKIEAEHFSGQVVIGHTRWATHGVPAEKNAHPHFSDGIVGVVHNGIIENHDELRGFLTSRGCVFTSDTDTEVIAHLIAYYMRLTSAHEAIRIALEKLHGQYALGIMIKGSDEVFCARSGSPLVLGIGFGENFFASDVSALLPVTSRFIYLEDGDIAQITPSDIYIFDRNDVAQERDIVESELSAKLAELGNYRHYMQKEIFEQPRAIADTISPVIEHGFSPKLFGPDAEAIFKDIEHITIIACGTSYHAGLVGRHQIENVVDIPVSVEIASEYRNRTKAFHKNDLVLAISQSGETADTIGAIDLARQKGAKILAICNVPESSIVRQADLEFITKAGPEIGVASTKAFTTQLAALRILAYSLASARKKLSDADSKHAIRALRNLPSAIKMALSIEHYIVEWAKEIASYDNCIFLGRGTYYPIAEEASLKLKEISYIHAEAYPFGELKHGPLALISADMPVMMLIPDDELLEKNVSNMEEVAARCGNIFVLGQSSILDASKDRMKIIDVPTTGGAFDPLVAIVPLQLLSYHVALIRGTDVDRPRNLAKSVTTL